MRPSITLTLALTLVLILAGCSGSNPAAPGPASHDLPAIESTWTFGNGFPDQLPVDALQPWEEGEKRAVSIDPATDFTAGRDWFLASAGGVSENGEAVRLTGQAGQSGYAIYRIAQGSGRPGTLALDANLLAGEGYYAAIANYGSGRWEFRGPFWDSHVRISLAQLPGGSAELISELNNAFVAIVVPAGAQLDVVGIGLNAMEIDDNQPPPQVGGLTAQPVSSGLELVWNPVLADDLAGYRIYHSAQPFSNPQAQGVAEPGYLEGTTRFVLTGLAGMQHVRIQAVDHAGNAGELSEPASAAALPGVAPQLSIASDFTSGPLDSPASMTVTGGESYDFDLDGDGVFELTGDSLGIAAIDTGRPGLIRPRVRASGPGGSAVALGALSVIVTGNTRPLASAVASPQSGAAPLLVSFSGEAEDSEDAAEELSYAWDFDGDGIYEPETDSLLPPAQQYNQPGVYNVKFRVTDSQGASDVDSIAILVTGIDQDNIAPFASLHASRTPGLSVLQYVFDASSSQDNDGSIIWYEWDLDGDGSYEAAGPLPFCQHIYPLSGNYTAALRVTDDDGETGTDQFVLTLPSAWPDFSGGMNQMRLSPYPGPLTDNVRWSFPSGQGTGGSAVIAPNGNIIFGTVSNEVHVVQPDGTPLWSLNTGGSIETTPAVAADGTIYVASNSDRLHAISPNGQEKWFIDTGDDLIASPAVGRDGRIYFGSNNQLLYAVEPSGQIIWTFASGGFIQGGIRIGLDGTVYFGCSDKKLYAVNPDGTLRWDYVTQSGVRSTPAIGDDGAVYFGSMDGILYSLHPEDELNWEFTTGAGIISSPAIGADGTIYFGSIDHLIYAVSPAGGEVWSVDTGDDIWSSPILDSEGMLYFGGINERFYALHADTGNVEWFLQLSDDIFGSPCISQDSAVYIVAGDGQLYSIGKSI